MIWLNLKELERRLINEEVSEKTGFHYLLAFMILFSIASYLPEDSPYSSEWWDFSEFGFGLLIKIMAMLTTFRINRKGGDNEFLKRYLSLSFVILLRLAILGTLLHLLYKIIMYVIPLDLYLQVDGMASGNIFELVLDLTLSAIYYLLLIRSFRRINRRSIIEAKGQMA